MTMTCDLPQSVAEYIDLVERGPYRTCQEQKALAALVRKAFETEDLIFNKTQFDNYMRLEKYFPFSLFPWQKFLISLWDCTYIRESGLPRWRTLFAMLGRGAGKDGFIAFDAFCSVSPFSEIHRYDVDICANLEEQATRPLRDLVEVMEQPPVEKRLKKHFYHTKEIVQGRKNMGAIRGRTNNPKSRDGMRTGKAIFNEIHQYESYANITVFRTGQGKVAHPRVGYFSSNGNVTDGPLDDLLARGRRILFEGEPDNGFLPFICCLKSKDEVHDPENWYMANPSLQYNASLLQETRDEYEEWKDHPEQNPDFLTKRMGLRATAAEIAVTDYDNVLATNQPLPDLKGWACVAGVDYAELNDWAAVNLHFKRGEQRYDINHAWLCTKSKTLGRLRIPWQEWANAGHITIVDDETIHPDLLAGWISTAMTMYSIKALAMDHYRWTLVSNSFKQIGFYPERKTLRLVRPRDIMTVEPVIQDCFNRHLFTWGNAPHLRWATNNTKRVPSSKKIGSDTGNFYYAKIEAKSRKTDPFMALVASMTIEPLLGTGAPPRKPLPVITL